jgi:ubiquinone/menaquinone biosynthesis C-methylase UbiE
LRGHPIFAAAYDLMTRGVERGGLAQMRAELLGEARGRTLELGAGTGHNLAHYPDSVEELVLTEPDPHMARRLRRRLAAAPPEEISAVVVEAPAEALPFEDGSFDSLVATLVLCTVEKPDTAAKEIVRVLRPGGRVLVLEHVRSGRPGLARWQDRLERPWGWVAGGCHPNRDTMRALDAAGLDTHSLDPARMAKTVPIVRPMVRGAARRPDSG